MYSVNQYDVIVVGAGHAGCEAALASARLGAKTLLATISLDNIAFLPCNPSVGGPAKGHLVREIDALGGQMGLIADQACIQMRMLNIGKGPAVRALRAQEDKVVYQTLMKNVVENQENLDVKQLMIDELILNNNIIEGVVAETKEKFLAPCVILATGTYLQSRIIYGNVDYSSGPNGFRPSKKLSKYLAKIGIQLMRFKSGTPARIDSRTVDFSKMEQQPGDNQIYNFSFMSEVNQREQTSCWLTYTNEKTHQVINNNLNKAAMFTGLVKGVGPRYCPSIESKLVRFSDKPRHQLFIEPEGMMTNEMYVQGMSSSLPAQVQLEFLQTIEGLENVKMMRAGYAIDYDCLDPLQLQASLEHKQIGGLFSAGQANGTSGYEEAAAQGLIAGINAVRKLHQQEPFILSRSDAYIGVLIDDLVTKGTEEPYRMMTSRAEYRLLLQQDNADLRLTEKGRQIGLVDDKRYQHFINKQEIIQRVMENLTNTRVNPTNENNQFLQSIGSNSLNNSVTLLELLRRPEINYDNIQNFFNLEEVSNQVKEQVEMSIKYEGYIRKQKLQIEKAEKLENKKIPDNLDYLSIKELGMEAREKLDKMRPISLGQASRISGVSPADINVLLIYLEQQSRKGQV